MPVPSCGWIFKKKCWEELGLTTRNNPLDLHGDLHPNIDPDPGILSETPVSNHRL